MQSIEQLQTLDRYSEPPLTGPICDLVWSDPLLEDILGYKLSDKDFADVCLIPVFHSKGFIPVLLSSFSSWSWTTCPTPLAAARTSMATLPSSRFLRRTTFWGSSGPTSARRRGEREGGGEEGGRGGGGEAGGGGGGVGGGSGGWAGKDNPVESGLLL